MPTHISSFAYDAASGLLTEKIGGTWHPGASSWDRLRRLRQQDLPHDDRASNVCEMRSPSLIYRSHLQESEPKGLIRGGRDDVNETPPAQSCRRRNGDGVAYAVADLRRAK